jgi:hypothetical protein
MKFNVKWGDFSEVKAVRLLVYNALKDPLNQWFCTISEADIPLHPFPKFRSVLLSNTKSVVNACIQSDDQLEVNTRWRDSLDKVGMKKENWRKSSNWVALNRKHSILFANEDRFDEGWESIPIPSEHYVPTLLSHYGEDLETTCSDGFTSVHFVNPLADSHPHLYYPEEINIQLFQSFTHEIIDVGTALNMTFSHICSGFTEICHFVARKFPSASVS